MDVLCWDKYKFFWHDKIGPHLHGVYLAEVGPRNLGVIYEDLPYPNAPPPVRVVYRAALFCTWHPEYPEAQAFFLRGSWEFPLLAAKALERATDRGGWPCLKNGQWLGELHGHHGQLVSNKPGEWWVRIGPKLITDPGRASRHRVPECAKTRWNALLAGLEFTAPILVNMVDSMLVAARAGRLHPPQKAAVEEAFTHFMAMARQADRLGIPWRKFEARRAAELVDQVRGNQLDLTA